MEEWIPQLIRALELIGVAAITASAGLIASILHYKSNKKKMLFDQKFKIGEYKYNSYENRIFIVNEMMQEFHNTVGKAMAVVCNPENIMDIQINVEKVKVFMKNFLPLFIEAPNQLEEELKTLKFLDQSMHKDLEFVRESLNQNFKNIDETNAAEKLAVLSKATGKLQNIINKMLEKKRDEIFDQLLK